MTARLSAQLDTLIGIIAAAQEPDGYLYTFRTAHVEHPHEWIGAKRWEKEEELSHELYNAGHFIRISRRPLPGYREKNIAEHRA